MTKINGIDFNNSQNKIYEKYINNESGDFNKLFIITDCENQISENKENIIADNNDIKILIDNALGKINKIENYNIQINVIPNKEGKNIIEEIAFTDYMSIVSSLNKITHHLS